MIIERDTHLDEGFCTYALDISRAPGSGWFTPNVSLSNMSATSIRSISTIYGCFAHPWHPIYHPLQSVSLCMAACFDSPVHWSHHGNVECTCISGQRAGHLGMTGISHAGVYSKECIPITGTRATSFDVCVIAVRVLLISVIGIDIFCHLPDL